MSTIRDILKRTPIRPLYRWSRRTYRNILFQQRMKYHNIFFRQTMKRLLAEPGFSLDDPNTLSELERGWGNPISASVEYLQECVSYASQKNLTILECGSGLSTLVVGLIAKKYGNTVWSLEDSKSWYKKMQHYLEKYRIDSVKLLHTPLTDYGDFYWYDAPLDAMPERFSLIICDGPTRLEGGRRYGLFPVMNQAFSPGCIILFDDINIDTEYEQNGLDHWLKKLKLKYESKYEKHGSSRPFFIITVPDTG